MCLHHMHGCPVKLAKRGFYPLLSPVIFRGESLRYKPINRYPEGQRRHPPPTHDSNDPKRNGQPRRTDRDGRRPAPVRRVEHRRRGVCHLRPREPSSVDPVDSSRPGRRDMLDLARRGARRVRESSLSGCHRP